MIARTGFVAVVLCLAFPTVAPAARIELVTGGVEVAYTAAPGEVNAPLLQRHGNYWYLQDTAGPPTDRVPPCEANPEHTGLGVSSRCSDPTGYVIRATIDLGDLDDNGYIDANTLLFIPVTVRGGPGNDRLGLHSASGNVLDGGPGNDVITTEKVPSGYAGGVDVITAGDGDDRIFTADDAGDNVRCGSGSDQVDVDVHDNVALDCETVIRQPTGQGWSRADGKQMGVSINNGATYTNDRDVRVRARGPDGVTHVLIANDGGFTNWLTVQWKQSEIYRFELASSGRERLPKTVYARFSGPDLGGGATFTDDIILDETRPVLRWARVLRHPGGRTRIALNSRDRTSGVKWMQFARRVSKPWRRIRYHRRVSIRRTPRWARVYDGASNTSRWHRVTR